MQIFKPQALGLSFRPMQYRHRFGLCVSGYLHVPFAQPPGGALWGEQSMWDFLAQEMGAPLIDEGIAKLTPEFLVHGRAYTEPARRDAVAVRARLGAVEKTLLVFGERYWNGRQPSEPAPFEQMPLGWAQAYGGPGHAANPAGKGHKPVEGVRWLPNVESPAARILRPGQKVEPVGFAALDVMHPQRAALRGTYDDAWFKQHSPGFAPDLDWNHFNMAPRDQWLPAPLRGDEAFAFGHMHPTQPHIEGALPGLCVRVFAEYGAAEGDGADGDWREVPMRLTTVWCFPHAERLVLVFHGLTEVAEDDGADVRSLIGGVERIGEADQRDAAYYQEIFRKRTQGEDAALHAINDADLLPPGLDVADPEFDAKQAVMKPEGLHADAQYRRAWTEVEMARDRARAQGRDPDALGMRMPPREKPPTVAELPAYMAKARKQMEEQQWETLETIVTQIERVRDLVQSKKLDPAKLVHRGPPVLNTAAQLEAFRKAHARAGKPFDEAGITAKLKQAEAVQRLNYLQTAHMQTPALRLEGEADRDLRQGIEWLLNYGLKTWAGMEFVGADFSNLDLRGIDFTGAWLESADFTGANLSGANLTGAVLAHANLSGVTATDASFLAANLGAANLEQAVFEQADLRGAILSRAHLNATRMHGARLDQAQLLETRWERADWSAATGLNLLFHKLDLSGCGFAGATLSGGTFAECTLHGTDFRGANLTGANFVDCDAEGADFGDAQLTGAVFAKGVQGMRLTNANFSGAALGQVNLAGCDASGACFVRARLDAAFLGQARLAGCDLRLASAKGAVLRKAMLRGAKLAGVDFKDAILQNADLREADLRGAHLFGADLSRVRLDAGVRFDDAVFERTRTYPRLTPEEHAGLPRNWREA